MYIIFLENKLPKTSSVITEEMQNAYLKDNASMIKVINSDHSPE